MTDDTVSIAASLEQALAFHQSGELGRAERLYEQILRIDPSHADAWHLRGVAAHQKKRHETAVACISRAIRLCGNSAVYFANLGAAYWSLGQSESAMAAYREALRLSPDWAEAHINLATVCLDAGLLDDARHHYQQGLARDENSALAWNNLGGVHLAQGDIDAAASCYRRAIQIRPEHVDAHANLGQLLNEEGQIDEAAACFWRAARLEPHKTLRELRIATLCPDVFDDVPAIDRFRRTLAVRLRQFAERGIDVDLSELAESGAAPPFNLLFHGRDNRELKEAYAGLFQGSFGTPRPVRRRGGGRPKIGFVVTARHEAAFLTSMGGILKQLDASAFRLIVVCHRSGRDDLARGLAGSPIEVVAVRERFDQVAAAVARLELDVLYHWEPGTDATNYFLPFLGLAPVQCTSWGIPDTSGIPQIDYYITSRLFETGDAGSRYSERLIVGRSLLTWQQPTVEPLEAPNRDDLGLPARSHLYVCVQQLRKFHPDFDPLLAGILRRDPAGLVVAVEDRRGVSAERLRRRFSRTLTDVASRVLFLPWQAYREYLGLLSCADVVLDAPHCGGGFTTFDAVRAGRPIVTLPALFRRSRFALGCYRRMNVDGCVARDADQYIEIAVRLGTDAEYRKLMADHISQRAALLFADGDAVREYQQIFERLAAESQSRN